jgi:hypothetical protein
MNEQEPSRRHEPGDGMSHDRRQISRRGLLAGGAGAAAAFFAAHSTGDFGLLREAAARSALPPASNTAFRAMPGNDFDDEPFDPAAVVDGTAGWFPSRYGEGDELGTLNEITPQKTLEALHLFRNNRNKPPKVYNMGELMEPGMPAFGTRVYVQDRLGPGAPIGDNLIVGMEETIETTYQVATQIDNLNHIGVGNIWYNGFTTEQMIENPDNPHGSNFLGQHLVVPFVTRGLLLDVLSVKVAQGDSDALGEPVDGKPILGNSYRITVEDLEAAMEFGKTGPIKPGDMVTIRTGWTHLFDGHDEEKRDRYLESEPGPYLREARWLAQFRPAIVASDTWAWEVLPAPEPWSATQLFPCHQELLTHHGIRIGEAFVSEGLADDGVYEFLFFYTGQRARWATAANVAPGAIGQSLRGPANPSRN